MGPSHLFTENMMDFIKNNCRVSFAGKFKNYAIQSKICEKSLINTCNKIKKTIKTDNLIFANIKTNIDNKKKLYMQ